MNRFAFLLVILTSSFFSSLQAAPTLETDKNTFIGTGNIELFTIEFPNDPMTWESDSFISAISEDRNKGYELKYIPQKEKQANGYITVDSYGYTSYPEHFKEDPAVWIDFSSKSQEELVRDIYFLRSIFLQVGPEIIAAELEIPIDHVITELNLLQKDSLQMIEMSIELLTPVVIDDETLSSTYETIIVSPKNIYFLNSFETTRQEHRDFVNTFQVQ
ncbi:MAG: hypothetical protein ACI9S8_001429 [Chlamydiales bacterium]|jgi:hypothetical protein